MKVNLEEYKRTGYTIIKGAITKEDLKIAQHETLKLKRWFNIFNKFGQPKDYGTGEYWKGIELAGLLSKPLMELYTSKKQYDLAVQFLETKDIYLFNDEVVVKNGRERFDFLIHSDNEFGPDPEGALRRDFSTVNLCWMLDDINEHNGPISFLNTETAEWETPYPNEGDIVAFDGNTIHSSTHNDTDKIRRCWATVYTTIPMGTYFNNEKWPLPHFKGFYNDKFEV